MKNEKSKYIPRVSAWGAHQRVRISKSFTKKSLTTQDAIEECDINTILERFQKTGHDPYAHRRALSKFGDWTGFPEYQESMNMVIEARDAFNQLPAKTREKFNNDPIQFLNYATNPENLNEMVSLGLAIPRPEADLTNRDLLKGLQETLSPSEDPIAAPTPPKGKSKPQQGGR